MTNEKFMRVALDEAHAGVDGGDGGPFGAVIVKNEKIIAQAHNTVLKDHDPTQHAEIKAISEASRKLGNHDLSGCEIYTTTEPCTMCFSAIHWAKIDRLIYGTTINDVQRLGFNELPIPAEKMKELASSPVKIESGFMKDECLKLLDHWKSLPEKKTY